MCDASGAKAGDAQCCPACKPAEGLPSWHGGSKDELACAVVAEAKRLGLPHWAQWAYIMGTIQGEAAGQYQPIRECYSVSSVVYCKGTYFPQYPEIQLPYYGRGYVQITKTDDADNYVNFQVCVDSEILYCGSQCLALRTDWIVNACLLLEREGLRRNTCGFTCCTVHIARNLLVAAQLGWSNGHLPGKNRGDAEFTFAHWCLAAGHTGVPPG